jgi:enoyl-CoA hydratase/carnithine racemase/NADP-dependent 3-hydroxy acid dehydrogenase YdfG
MEIPNYKTALIVGAGEGLSASLARLLSHQGLRIALAARHIEKLGALCSETGASAFACNATDPDEVERLFGAVERELGAPDVVVYNASARARGAFVDLVPAEVAQAIAVSAFGGFLVAQQAVRRMLPGKHGAILFTGASASVKGYPQSAPFAMGKFALRGLAQSMARELSPQGIHVAHFVIDGGIRSSMRTEPADRPDSMLDPDAIALNYWNMITTETKIDTGTDELLCAIRDRVAVITLNRPEVRNALSDHLTPALRTMIKTCGENPEVGALLITGAGTAFCAGGNVKGMGAHRDKKKLEMSYDEKVADLQERQRLLTGALVSVRKPTIAALPGPAVGAGLAIAMACDIRIAAESAFVSTGYLRVGLSGDYGIAWLLTRLVGTARARELMFTADRVDARRCEAIGLVNRVVPDAKLQDEAFALAKSMADGPKDNLDEALLFDFATARDHEAERLIRTTMTADHKEAVQAFIDKRKAVFKGS